VELVLVVVVLVVGVVVVGWVDGWVRRKMASIDYSGSGSWLTSSVLVMPSQAVNGAGRVQLPFALLSIFCINAVLSA